MKKNSITETNIFHCLCQISIFLSSIPLGQFLKVCRSVTSKKKEKGNMNFWSRDTILPYITSTFMIFVILIAIAILGEQAFQCCFLLPKTKPLLFHLLLNHLPVPLPPSKKSDAAKINLKCSKMQF